MKLVLRKSQQKELIILNMYVNRTALKAEMVLKNIDTKYMLNYLNISDTSYYNKINGKKPFHEREIKLLSDLFGTAIFFS